MQKFRTIYIGYMFRNTPNNQIEKAMDISRKMNLIEPVVEGVLQLFFQSIIIYIAVGPGEGRQQSKYRINKTSFDTQSTELILLR